MSSVTVYKELETHYGMQLINYLYQIHCQIISWNAVCICMYARHRLLPQE